MTESMRERMARAAWYALNQSTLTRDSDPYEIAAAFDMADAILDVLAEPSDGVLYQGLQANVFVNDRPCGDSCIGRLKLAPTPVWTAMLAAIRDGK